MQIKALLASTSLVGALAWLTMVPAQAQVQAGAALTGQVSSAEEGAMEGVLVSAKKDGATVTTTVVSNDKGQFSVPADRLGPGHYTITIRAAGYNLVGPKAVDVAQGAPARTAEPTPDRATSMRLTSLPCLTKSSMRPAGMMTISAPSPPPTRLVMSAVPPQSIVTLCPDAFSNTGTSSR